MRLETATANSAALPGSAFSSSTEDLSARQTENERLQSGDVPVQMAGYRKEHSAEHMAVMENEVARGKSVEDADKMARMRVGE